MPTRRTNPPKQEQLSRSAASATWRFCRHRYRQLFLHASLVVLAVTVSGCGQPAATHAFETATSEIEVLAIEQSRRTADELLRERGGNVFSHYCAICHGGTGAGDGFNSFNLKVPPCNFTEAEFWTTTTRERTEQVIADGGPAAGGSMLMPAWKRTLSNEQIEDVVAYLRMLPDIHAAALAAEAAVEEADAQE